MVSDNRWVIKIDDVSLQDSSLLDGNNKLWGLVDTGSSEISFS